MVTRRRLMPFMASIIMAVMLSKASYAQSTAFDRMTPPLPTTGERKAADIASFATLGTAMAFDFKAAWDVRDNRAHAVQMFAARALVTFVSASIAKGLAGRVRPDESNNQSFYSMHYVTEVTP